MILLLVEIETDRFPQPEHNSIFTRSILHQFLYHFCNSCMEGKDLAGHGIHVFLLLLRPQFMEMNI